MKSKTQIDTLIMALKTEPTSAAGDCKRLEAHQSRQADRSVISDFAGRQVKHPQRLWQMQQLDEQVSLQCQFIQTLQRLHLEAATNMSAICCARSCGKLLTKIVYTVLCSTNV